MHPSATPTQSPSNPPSDTPTVSPSTAPTQTCNVSEEERKRLIDIRLAEVSDPNALNATGTPQNLARSWLIDSDTAYTCPDDSTIVPRYAMAVFYYSTEGGDWAKCSAPSDFADPAAVAAAYANCPGTPWLTNGTVCNWAGLTCNETSGIERIDIGECLDVCQTCMYINVSNADIFQNATNWLVRFLPSLPTVTSC